MGRETGLTAEPTIIVLCTCDILFPCGQLMRQFTFGTSNAFKLSEKRLRRRLCPVHAEPYQFRSRSLQYCINLESLLIPSHTSRPSTHPSTVASTIHNQIPACLTSHSPHYAPCTTTSQIHPAPSTAECSPATPSSSACPPHTPSTGRSRRRC
jgi:hypothetical protein